MGILFDIMCAYCFYGDNDFLDHELWCVTSRNLRWNKLQDVIPAEIGELKRLTHL